MQVVRLLAHDDAVAGVAVEVPRERVVALAEQQRRAPLEILTVLQRKIDALGDVHRRCEKKRGQREPHNGDAPARPHGGHGA